ncbi:MAG: GyrI-like domain-containing protein [Candidatus Limnocylindrales bacterium]
MSTFEIRQTTKRPTAALKMTRPVTQIGPAMAEAFPKLFHAVASAGMEPAGTPLARYYEFGETSTTFECALPVPRAFTAAGEIEPSTVGGGDAAFALHVGPYDTIGETWGRLMAWVAEQGRTPAGPTWEVYIDDPQEVAVDQLKTELYVPLA